VPGAAEGVPPHVTLLGPWRPAPLSPTDFADLAAAIAGIPPFHLTFRQLGRFGETVLYLRPEPDEPLCTLIQRLIDAFPETPPYGGEFSDVVPHLTVAMATSGEELDPIERELLAELGAHPLPNAFVEAIEVVEEQRSSADLAVTNLPLGSAADKTPRVLP
jgi:2'-5' RNA ligase